MIALVLAIVLGITLGAAPGAQPMAPDDHLPRPMFPAAVALMADPAKALAALDREPAARGDSPPIEALVLRAHLLSEAHRLQESVSLWDEIGGRDDRLREFTGRVEISEVLGVG